MDEGELITLSSRIGYPHAGRTLIDFLCGRFRYHCREEWEHAVREGSVRVNGEMTTPCRVLKKGDVVSYQTILREPPVDGAIRVIHEEESFLIADKPGNLPSHADGNFITHTFIFIIKRMMAHAGYRGPLKLAHRLDRETSGLMLVAKNLDAHRRLMRQFSEGVVEKEYLAIARGLITQDEFRVHGGMIRDPASRISVRRIVVPEGTPGSKPAATRFRVIERLNGFTLLCCVPETGRTNQIRAHLAHAGYPLAGDKLYGRSDEEFLAFVGRVRAGDFSPPPWLEAPRHLLHASRLSFHHPVTGERVAFKSPLPEDMRSFIEAHR